MTIDELIKKLVIVRMNHGNIQVAKMFLVKDSYETSKKEVVFQDIEPKFGLMRQIVTEPHQIFSNIKTGSPFMVQMKVDDESKERFSYESNYILKL